MVSPAERSTSPNCLASMFPRLRRLAISATSPPTRSRRAELSMATSMSTCILTALMSAGASWGRAAPMPSMPAPYWAERGGYLFGLREALRDDDAVARLFGDERFEG